MEIHVLKLEKLPKEEQDEAGIIRWMRFLGAKSRREFESSPGLSFTDARDERRGLC